MKIWSRGFYLFKTIYIIRLISFSFLFASTRNSFSSLHFTSNSGLFILLLCFVSFRSSSILHSLVLACLALFAQHKYLFIVFKWARAKAKAKREWILFGTLLLVEWKKSEKRWKNEWNKREILCADKLQYLFILTNILFVYLNSLLSFPHSDACVHALVCCYSLDLSKHKLSFVHDTI